ncbi:MAG: lysostaphin resistance A-like protein [Planctomycetota bacterium]|jgi:membrane protease YdiL (CAAX protease family)
MDKRTIRAFGVIVLIEVCLKLIWPFAREHILWLRPLFHYRRLILAVLSIGAAVLILEKAHPSTIGLTMKSYKRTLLTTAVTGVYTLIAGYLVVLFWRQLGQVRAEGNEIHFIGNVIPRMRIGPRLLCLMVLDQIATVALPEEMIYRGYFQSRLSYSCRPVFAILGSTVLFALVHLDRPLMLLHLVLIAPAWGYAYHYSKSIFPSVVVHCLANIGLVLIIERLALS